MARQELRPQTLLLVHHVPSLLQMKREILTIINKERLQILKELKFIIIILKEI